MDGDVSDFDWYLNSNCSGKARFAIIKVKGDKSSIGWVYCPKAESSDFRCVGQVWRTSKTDMSAGDCAKSSTKL